MSNNFIKVQQVKYDQDLASGSKKCYTEQSYVNLDHLYLVETAILKNYGQIFILRFIQYMNKPYDTTSQVNVLIQDEKLNFPECITLKTEGAF
jgi:hypothetical protein